MKRLFKEDLGWYLALLLVLSIIVYVVLVTFKFIPDLTKWFYA